MNFAQALVMIVMLADFAAFIYDTERGRGKPNADGFVPLNRHIIDMARRQL